MTTSSDENTNKEEETQKETAESMSKEDVKGSDVNETSSATDSAGENAEGSSASNKGSAKPTTPANTGNKKTGGGRRGSLPALKTPTEKHGSVKDGPASPGPSKDVHPYPRGAVIEVLYIPAQAVGKTTSSIQAAATSSDPWYWSEDSSLCSTTSASSDEETSNVEDEEDGEKKNKEKGKGKKKDVEMKDAEPQSPTKTGAEKSDEDTDNTNKSPKSSTSPHHHHHHHHHQNASSVRLCDIIDRVPANNAPATGTLNATTGAGGWRYYVHYRDFNRRMDEWIPIERIVSPPSVGNAKARALKKEEERLKRKQQRLEEKQRAEQLKKEHDVELGLPRTSRRRTSVSNTPGPAGGSLNAGSTPGQTPGGGGALTPGSGGDVRATRWQRRKSTHAGGDDDAATVVASNQVPDHVSSIDKEPVAVKEIVTLPAGSSSAMATTTVGEHVVATIPAQELDEHEGLDEASIREHEEITKIKNVSFIELGRHQMETWYFSPIPKELLSQQGYIEVLYICEFTFRMFARKCELKRFQQRSLKPQDRHPPGNEIYRKDNISMFEVDGLTEKIYCQNLCYIAKLFLDHKTLYFDCDPFLFYVLCEVDDRGYHPVGYYSKEKYSDVGYNLACILTFPAHQRKGYGRFLIAFSYELSKKQEKVGGPERPVSDLGQKAYKPYWAATVIDFLRHTGQERDAEGNILSSSLSIMDISKKTSIMSEDIVFTLNQLGILKIINGVYFIAAEESLLEKLAKKYPVKEPRVDPTQLHWTPFLTDIKRDKFSIHSKKPTVESSSSVAVQQIAAAAEPQQQGQTG